jgi:hypothetical protein
MSATKLQQQLAIETSWLAQLRVNAEYAECDASALARERFNKPLDALTVAEAQTLAWEYAEISHRKAEAERAARTPINGPHSHPCFQCGEPVRCAHDNCRETSAEHRYCHEGYTASEWVSYHRKHGDGWQLS